MAPGQVRDAWIIDHRSSAEAPHTLLRAALENGAAGGAKVATVMGHARPDTANVGDVLLAEPHRVRFAGRALLRGPLLRGGGRRREREREAQKRRSGYDRPEVWLGTNVHYRSSIWFLFWYLLLMRRPWQAASPCYGLATAPATTRLSRFDCTHEHVRSMRSPFGCGFAIRRFRNLRRPACEAASSLL